MLLAMIGGVGVVLVLLCAPRIPRVLWLAAVVVVLAAGAMRPETQAVVQEAGELLVGVVQGMAANGVDGKRWSQWMMKHRQGVQTTAQVRHAQICVGPDTHAG